jgi:hypothetical protein
MQICVHACGCTGEARQTAHSRECGDTLESTLELGAQQCTQEHVLLTCGQCVANVLLEYMIELGAPHTHTHTHRLNE